MTQSTKNRVIEYLLGGMAVLLTVSAFMRATPVLYTIVGLPVLLAVYILLYGVEHSLRATAAWCMGWAEGIAHRKQVRSEWIDKLSRNEQSGLLTTQDEEQLSVPRKVAVRA